MYFASLRSAAPPPPAAGSAAGPAGRPGRPGPGDSRGWGSRPQVTRGSGRAPPRSAEAAHARGRASVVVPPVPRRRDTRGAARLRSPREPRVVPWCAGEEESACTMFAVPETLILHTEMARASSIAQ